eukprot:8771906-Alexandrium_andersonii.AAC.1
MLQNKNAESSSRSRERVAKGSPVAQFSSADPRPLIARLLLLDSARASHALGEEIATVARA